MQIHLTLLDPRRSLRARLALSVGGACLLLALLSAGLQGALAQAAATADRRTELQSLARRVANALDEDIYVRYREVQLLASLYSIRNPDILPTYKRQLLEEIQASFGQYAWIGITDAYGRVDIATGGLLEGGDVSARPWYQSARVVPFVGDVHDALLLAQLLGEDPDEPLRFLDIAAPIRTLDGAYAGVLGAHVDWAWAHAVRQRILLPFQNRPGLEVLILAHDGTVLLGPTIAEPGLTHVDTASLLAGDADAAVHTWPDGVAYLTGHAVATGHRDYAGLGWTIIARQPAAAAFAQARATQLAFILWGALLGIALFFGTWWIGGTVVKPVVGLAASAEHMTGNGLDGQLPVLAGDDEIASLSRTLHTLVGRLHEQNRRSHTAAERLRALHLIDRAIMESRELQPSLDTVVRETVQRLNVAAADILLFDEASNVLTYAAGSGFRTTEFAWRVELGQGVSGTIASERKGVFVQDVNSMNWVVRQAFVQNEQMVAYAAFPLINQDALVGVLEVWNRAPLPEDAEWVAFLESIVLQTAIAIEHVSLFTQTLGLLEQTGTQARRLDQILQTVPQGIILLDAQHRPVHVNPAASHLLTLLGEQAEDGRLARFAGQEAVGLLQPTDTGERWRELTVQEQGLYLSVAATPIADDPDQHGWVMAVIDVTHERRRQEAIQRQERLATIGQLTAGIGHDFNNILTPILLMSQVLLTKVDAGSPVHNGLTRIEEAALRAKDLIAQILSYSRASADSPQTLIYLQPLIVEVTHLLRAVLPAGIEIRHAVDPGVPGILGNATQLHQVLVNLCTNAQHAMGERGVLSMSLETVRFDAPQLMSLGSLAPGHYARLAVQDTGAGMDRATIVRLFDPFFTTKAVGQGTGLGLSVVAGIVLDHSGDIQVESAPEQGSTFALYLPLSDVVASQEQPAVTLAAGNNRHILLVDDEEAILNAAAAVLESLGYRVTAEQHSAIALRTFLAQPDAFDMLVCDYNMPEMTGEELIAYVRRVSPNLLVVLMSGSSKVNLRRQIVELNINAFLPKPFTIAQISAVIDQVFQAADETEP